MYTEMCSWPLTSSPYVLELDIRAIDIQILRLNLNWSSSFICFMSLSYVVGIRRVYYIAENLVIVFFI